MRGCPLRCRWCHSPEGQKSEVETLHFPNLPDRTCGKVWNASLLSEHLNSLTAVVPGSGVTFSGGEPMMQAKFLSSVIDHLTPGTHTIIDTCGFVPQETFLQLAKKASYIFFGLKLLDDENAIRWTGQPSAKVIQNLLSLDAETSTSYRLRIPLLHGITDTPDYFDKLEKLCSKLKRIDAVDFLPSNRNAGAKYSSCGKIFTPGFDPEYDAVLPKNLQTAFPVRLLGRDEV